MAAIGIDFGNDSCLIAVARQGRRGIEVLQNEVGKRNTPSMVAFTRDQRIVGAEAESNYQSNFRNTVVNFKQLIGRPFNDELARTELKHNPYKVVADARGNAGVEVNWEGQPTVFTPEEISAAMLLKLRDIAEKQGARSSDCVVAVPPFWTDGQRRAMLESCRLAGLNVLSLLNETTAVALSYGIIRPPPAEGHQHVLFVDVGHSATYATVCKFEQGKVTVVATENAFTLGGREFDQILMDYIADYCRKKYQLDVEGNAKATIKLRKEAQRIKKFLSANKEAQFRIEYFIDEKDVAGDITRQQFEELSAPLLGELRKVVDTVMARAGLRPDDLHFVEIVGGAARIPCVQEALKQHLGRELSRTCDGDESVARGAALRCAMLSPSFRVRQYEVVELNPYSVEIGWHFAEQPELGEDGRPKLDGRAELFESQCVLPTERSITFKPRPTPLTLVANYKNPADFPEGTDPRVARFVVSGMPAELPSQEIPDEYKDMEGLKLAKPKIKVYLSLDSHGLIGVTSAQILTETLRIEPKPEAPAAAPAAAAAEPSSEAAAAGGEAEASAGDKMDTSQDAGAEASAAATPAPAAALAPPKKVKQRIPLQVSSEFFGAHTAEEFKVMEEREAAVQATTAAVEALAAARNELESYVLEVRSKVRGEWSEFIPKDAAQQFVDQLNDMEDWIYDEGEQAQKSELLQHLATLKKTGEVYQRRWYEANNREDAFAAFEAELPALVAWADEKDKAPQENISAEEVAKVRSSAEAARGWIAEARAKIDAAPKDQDPPVGIAQIQAQQRDTLAAARPIMTRPLPPPKKDPPAAQQTQPQAAADDGAAEAAPATADDAAMQDDDAAAAMQDDDAPEAAAPEAASMDTSEE